MMGNKGNRRSDIIKLKIGDIAEYKQGEIPYYRIELIEANIRWSINDNLLKKLDLDGIKPGDILEIPNISSINEFRERTCVPLTGIKIINSSN